MGSRTKKKKYLQGTKKNLFARNRIGEKLMIPYTGEDEMPRNCPKLSQWGFPLEVQFF